MEYNHNNEESKYYNSNYRYENIFFITLILNHILQYLDKNNLKCFYLINKKIYQIYCNQVKKVKINNEAKISNLQVIDKYNNVINLDLTNCKNIKDFTPISKLERLEILNISYTKISDIPFLEKNKTIKELNLCGCKNIKDFISISKLKRLEYLNIGYANVSDISFLEIIKILKNYI